MPPRKHTPPWLLDELAEAGRENLDSEHASHYDEKEAWPAAEEVEFVAALGVSAESVVVDLGAGTGQFSLAAAARFGRVIAVDVSEVMLDVLERKVAAASVENVETNRAGFLTYEHRGAPADLIHTRYALHHLPDFWKAVAFKRMHDMLRPGGILRLWDIVYSFDLAETEERLEAWSSTLDAGDGSAQWVRSDIDEHIRDEHSTFSWLLEEMMRRAGFEIEQADYSDDGIFGRYVLRRT